MLQGLPSFGPRRRRIDPIDAEGLALILENVAPDHVDFWHCHDYESRHFNIPRGVQPLIYQIPPLRN
jgi:hypothetical protein